ncbi:DNA-binding response regulator [Pediococcus pentosaceus]|uniref:response regulator transcription factor n=1 Tax=Pediococcus pentosaceus TaxID=1255 RepID=UPI0021A63D49|nr:response regulator transcription factor [Pediococcus pentosaceus]MCT3023905.1 DNA-binding response regulator [Pediococcus pentosaceus]
MIQKILLVDDEFEITDINMRYLVNAGYEVIVAHDGIDALNMFKGDRFSLVITDVMMPKMSGYDLIDEIQILAPDQPFLFITAKTSDQDKIFSLSLGADDFISKPFSPRELVLRVNNILRRINHGKSSNKIKLGNLELDEQSHEAYANGSKLEMTVKEFELLRILINSPKHVFSKTELYQQVWNREYFEASSANTVNVHIHELRQKLAESGDQRTPVIETVWGLGYKMGVKSLS